MKFNSESFPIAETQPTPKQTGLCGKDPLKIGMSTQSQPTNGVRSPHMRGSETEFLAAVASASLENIATADGGHSFSEAVGFGTFAFVRIISKAHGLSPEIKIRIEVTTIYHNHEFVNSQTKQLLRAFGPRAQQCDVHSVIHGTAPGSTQKPLPSAFYP